MADIQELSDFKTGISSYIRHVATRSASKQSVLERVILMNPVAKLVMSSPKYSEKYEDQDVDNNNDSDGDYVAKDKRSKSEILKEFKVDFVNNDNAQKLAKLITKHLTVVIKLMKLADSEFGQAVGWQNME